MKSLTLFILAMASSFVAISQCYTSGSPIEYVWVNQSGTYVDIASKRPLDALHHKIFDLTTGKFVKMWGPDKSFPHHPTNELGFSNEVETPYRLTDYYRSNMNGDYVGIWKKDKHLFLKRFNNYARISYDTAHGRGFIIEPDDTKYRFYWVTENGELEMISKNFKGDHAEYIFSPDGKYAVATKGGQTIIDMESRRVLKDGLVKDFNLLNPVISLDSKQVAFHAADYRMGAAADYLVILDLATQKVVSKQQFLKEKGKGIRIFPLPDMQRSIMFISDVNNVHKGPHNAWLVTPKGLEALCNPSWEREKDELDGKVRGAYDEVAKNAAGCPMEVAAMEAEGKWKLSIGNASGTLYLSARASGEVNGTYSYEANGISKKGKLSGKLTASKRGNACVHTISLTYDETLFGGDKGSVTLTIGVDGKSLDGSVNGKEWTAQKN